MLEHTITAPGGRRLQVLEDGDPGGSPILVHNGTPNSRLLYGGWIELAQRQAVRLISYDRPGYGGSDRHEGRTVADCAADVRAIAAGLGIDRLGVWGFSGGGPHALACAALLRDLVPAVGVIGSVAPYPAPGIDYFEGMGESNVEDIQLELNDPDAAYAQCVQEAAELAAATDAGAMMSAFETLLAPVDRPLAGEQLAGWLLESGRVGLAPGGDGWWDDGQAHLRDWGFELGSITTPVLLLHGGEDRFVPFQHGRWLAQHVPGCEARLTAEDGHLSLIVNRIEQVHEWLLARM